VLSDSLGGATDFAAAFAGDVQNNVYLSYGIRECIFLITVIRNL